MGLNILEAAAAVSSYCQRTYYFASRYIKVYIQKKKELGTENIRYSYVKK